MVGYLHPPDRYTAYLKYTPSRQGKWARGEVLYRRELPYYHVRNVLKTLEFLERHHPRYVWVDPVQQLKFSFVPRKAVTTYYVPEQRLAALIADARDPLEQDARDVVELLARHAGLDHRDFGITGSVLLGLHNPAFSDIDLTIYGRDATRAVRRAVEALRKGPLRDVAPERREAWRRETAERFLLTPRDIEELEGRRWNYARYGDRYVSLHATRRDDEITEDYGREQYRPAGIAMIEATIADARDAIFLPAVYGLTDVLFLEGTFRPLRCVVSFEGLYSGIADEGDRIVARGQLEAESRGDYRLIVGTGSILDGGFIRVIRRG